jgi:pyruvate/2-oxoglutarate dehydrogenase complex dihydrolipoamide dehydrogenase (E3) component
MKPLRRHQLVWLDEFGWYRTLATAAASSASLSGQPTAEAARKFLARVMRKARVRPRHLITDQGPQFTDDSFRAWCKRIGIRQRFGAIGKHGSIAVIDRHYNSLVRLHADRPTLLSDFYLQIDGARIPDYVDPFINDESFFFGRLIRWFPTTPGDFRDVFFGPARFIGSDALTVGGAILRFKKAMIATGARPDTPSILGLVEAGYLTNENVFDLTELPRRLLVIGGGPLGCELAQAFSRFGAKTIIAQDLPLFLPKEERDAAQILSSALARDGIEVRLNTTAVAVRVEHGQKLVDLVSDDYKSTVAVDAILTGTGRLPNVTGLNLEAAGVEYDTTTGIRIDDFLQTTNRRIYAAGDACLEHKFTHTADASARIVVQNALFLGRRRLSALTVPWCTYTDPEIAHVGLYVREARAQQIPVRTFTILMHDVDRAILDGEESGFVKIHVEERSDRILGATIVARHAGEMINEITVAMVAGIGLRALAAVIHAYPTQAEAIRKAADACSRARLTPTVRALLRRWLAWR